MDFQVTLLLQGAILLTHLSCQSDKLTLLCTKNIVAQIEQIILKQLSCQMCIITYVSWANLLKQTCTNRNHYIFKTVRNNCSRSSLDILRNCSSFLMRLDHIKTLDLKSSVGLLPFRVASPYSYA
nr:MAG TPA: hypothetical protein [Bacteriophage sp.]